MNQLDFTLQLLAAVKSVTDKDASLCVVNYDQCIYVHVCDNNFVSINFTNTYLHVKVTSDVSQPQLSKQTFELAELLTSEIKYCLQQTSKPWKFYDV